MSLKQPHSLPDFSMAEAEKKLDGFDDNFKIFDGLALDDINAFVDEDIDAIMAMEAQLSPPCEPQLPSFFPSFSGEKSDDGKSPFQLSGGVCSELSLDGFPRLSCTTSVSSAELFRLDFDGDETMDAGEVRPPLSRKCPYASVDFMGLIAPELSQDDPLGVFKAETGLDPDSAKPVVKQEEDNEKEPLATKPAAPASRFQIPMVSCSTMVGIQTAAFPAGASDLMPRIHSTSGQLLPSRTTTTLNPAVKTCKRKAVNPNRSLPKKEEAKRRKRKDGRFCKEIVDFIPITSFPDSSQNA
mmetsp:Transcript_15595/g.29279  ORF Transcript_15595/g.29279 Transcript_15595/m.29279 type:complete len:298 (+) Transcript_15595:364-1257(+)